MKKGSLAKDYFQYEDCVQSLLARTQVYLSKTKLRDYKQVSSNLYTKVHVG